MADRGLFIRIAGGVDPNTIKSMQSFAASLSRVGAAARGLGKASPGTGLDSTVNQIKRLDASVNKSINSIIGNIDKYKHSAKELADTLRSSSTKFNVISADEKDVAVAEKTAEATKKVADANKKLSASTRGQSDDLALRKKLLNEYVEDLGTSNQALKEAQRRTNEFTDQVTRLYRALHEAGAVKEGQETLEEFSKNIDVTKARMHEFDGSLKKTRHGFYALNEEARKALGVDREQFEAINEQLMKSEDRVDSFKKKLKELSTIDLDDLDTTDLNLYSKRLKELESDLKRLRKMGDITPEGYEDNIRKVERLQTAFKEYKGDLKELAKAQKAYEKVLKETGNSYEYADAEAQEYWKEFKKRVAQGYEYADAESQAFWLHYRKLVSDSYQQADAAAEEYWKERRRETAREYQYADAEAKAFYDDFKKRIRELSDLDYNLFSTKEINSEINNLEKTLFRLRNSLPDDELRKYRKIIDDAKDETKEFKKSTGRADQSLGYFGNSLVRVGKRMQQFGAFVIAAMAVQNVTVAVREFIQVVQDYDQSLHNLQAILDVTAAKSQILGDSIQKVAEQTKFSANETADGVQTLGQAGLSVNESINALQGVTDLATGTMSKFASVSDLVTTTLNAFHLEAVETNRVADVFANAINNSKASVDKLTTSFNYVGAAGHQAGLSLNEVTGVLMTLYDNGLRASTAGTGLRRMLLKMINPTDEVKDNIESMGISLDDLNPKLVGMEEAFGNLIPLLWDAENQTVNLQKAEDMFGTRAAQVSAVIVESVAKGNEALTEAVDKTREMGSASKMASTQLEGLGLKIKNLQDRLKNVGVAIGDAGFTGFLKDIIDALKLTTKALYDFIKGNEQLVEELGWAALVTTIVSGLTGMYQIFQKLMITGKLTVLFNAFQTTLSKIFVPTAIASGLVVALDRIISATDKAIDSAQELGAEYDVLSGKAETWGESLKRAYGTMEWESTVQKFKDAFKDVEDEHKNLVEIIEQGNERLGVEGIGFNIEDAVNVDQADRIIEKIREIQKASWVKSMEKNAESLAHVQKKAYEFSSAGIDLQEKLREIASDAGMFTKGMYSINESIDTVIPRFDTFKGFVMDVFGKDQADLLKDYNQSLEAIIKGFQSKPDFENWNIEELQNEIDALFDSVEGLSKESVIGEKIIGEVVFDRFSKLSADIDSVIVSYQKQQKELKKNKDLSDEEKQRLEELKEKTESLENVQKRVNETIKDAIINGTKYKDVNELLKNSLSTEEWEQYKKATSDAGQEQSNTTEATFNLRSELAKLDRTFAETYSTMSAIGKMNFADEFDEIKDDMKDFRSFLVNKLGKTEEEADKIIQKEKKKRVKSYLEDLKDSGEEERSIYSQWMTQISNAQKKALFEVEEGSKEALRIRKEYAERELDVAQKRFDEEASPENQAKLLDAKKKYADAVLAVEEKLTEDILNEVDKRIESIERKQEKAEVEIESRVISGDLTEAEAEVQIAKNNLETQKEIIEERKRAISLLKEEEANEKEINEVIEDKNEAELEAKEIVNEYKKAKIDQIKAVAEREKSLADQRRETALADIEREKTRTQLIESNQEGVIAEIEKEQQLNYENAKKKLQIEQQYKADVLQSYNDRLRNLRELGLQEHEDYKELLREKEEFTRETNRKITEITEERIRAQIRAEGSFFDRVKLGFQNARDDVKGWGDFTVDTAETVFNDFADGAANAFMEFATGAKSARESFQEFAHSFLKNIAEMIAKQLVLNAISSAMGGWGSLGSTIAQSPTMGASISPQAMGGTMHEGGIVGKDGGKRLSEIFNNALRLHDGLRPDEFHAVLQKGEKVTSKNDVNEEKTLLQEINRKLNNQQFGNNNQEKGTRIVNVLDPNLFDDWATSSGGEKVLKNFIKRNSSYINQVVK